MRKSEIKREQRNKLLIGIFLVIVMVASGLGVMKNQSINNIKYNGHKFQKTENGYVTKINNQKIFFSKSPSEVENLNLSQEDCSLIKNSPSIDILFKPDSNSLKFIDYIRNDFTTIINKPVISLVTNSSDNYPLYQTSSCDNATESQPIIYFKEGDRTSLTMENNCLIAESNYQNFLILRDRLLYCYLDIIQ